MAKQREIVCLHYVAFGECKKGREACHNGYCQKCDKYYPRAKVKKRNKKRQMLEKLKKSEYRSF